MVRLPGDLQQLGEFDESALSKLSYANGGLELKNKQLRLPLTPLKIKDALLYRLAPDLSGAEKS